MTCKPRMLNKVYSGLLVTISGAIGFVGISIYKGNDKFYSNFLIPFFQKIFDAETAHILTIKAAKYSLMPNVKKRITQCTNLKTNVFGLNFPHPVGLAAGCDKHGEAIIGLSKLGFSFIEIGSVTPLPQEGNDKPRVFRLPEDHAIVNRYGFNSLGHDVVKQNLINSLSLFKPLIVGVNLGKNKITKDHASDYVKGFEKFKDCNYVDYFVVNISSPNTIGLRDIQRQSILENFLDTILSEKARLNIDKPLLLKISPDLSDEEKKYIARIICKKRSCKHKIDGIIVSNTTVSRPSELLSAEAKEDGGLSGAPLKNLSTQMIRDMYKLTNGSIPIIGVGGVSSGMDAYEKLRAGASLLQLYTALTYYGPGLVAKIVEDLSDHIRQDGFNSAEQVIGIDSK